ncbi:MICOS complex subunit MIC19 [Cephus cinctus]|uniref:MICOS complex subunit MIC19 n=1 Tax=Cephus cinctus TaxID=211228 RepID=A0AAJ7FG59_CEPCN|nr:MICOS complex subunit MIC19 [Cephus cinctus]XP_015590209.1 MICOS complex subunit MIC19 [Cephus cinctus]XP_015590210.1 MICOS complex subunit MIC19 [Cephus cinctus]
MGSGQSARKLTISNEEKVGVIKVSNAVVQRLQGSENTTGTQDVRSSHPPQPALAASQAQESQLATGYPVYYPEYTISALEMQQQKEKELNTQDQYWQRRLRNLERNHEKINQILDAEYRKAIEEFSDGQGGKRVSVKSTVVPCVGNSNKVLKCYQDHPKETLKCSNLVEDFYNCVDQHRTTLIASRC